MTRIGGPVGEGVHSSSLIEMTTGPQHATRADKKQGQTDCAPDNNNDKKKSLCQHFIQDCVWPGLGLFGESYLLFSIGTLKPLWEYLYPECFNEEICSPRLLGSLTFSVVFGVMIGMVVLGYAANLIGRRKGSILTATFMALGAWGLTLVSIVLSSQPVWLYRSLSALFFCFGLGVGGEYPLSASSASEKAMQELKRKQTLESEQQQQQQVNNAMYDYKELYDTELKSKQATTTQNNVSNNPGEHRGREIQLVFSMQGMGILFNSITMTALLLLMGQGQILDDDQMPEYSKSALLAIWRIIYALGACVLTFVLVSRYFYLEESKVWAEDKEQREQVKRSKLLETVVSTKEEELLKQPDFVANTSSVSSLSAPSVTVDYHNHAVVTTGLASSRSSDQPGFRPHHQHHHTLQRMPSTDPEDDLKASPTWLLLQNYGLRLVGASLSWLLWDICFYSNKLFQSNFLITLTGESTTLLQFSMAATLNAAVALLGYLGAAMLVDKVGRRNLQQYGFLFTGSLFVSCGFLYSQLSSTTLVTLYLGSSFFGQLGPNATTFLIPAEIFPTEMRTMCHGICAASGKLGALIAAIIFNYMDNDLDLFLISGYASFVACLVTFCTIPETLGLDLYEIDKKWRMTLEGRKGDYVGDANHPRYLSFWERSKLYGTNNSDSHHIGVE